MKPCRPALEFAFQIWNKKCKKEISKWFRFLSVFILCDSTAALQNILILILLKKHLTLPQSVFIGNVNLFRNWRVSIEQINFCNSNIEHLYGHWKLRYC